MHEFYVDKPFMAEGGTAPDRNQSRAYPNRTRPLKMGRQLHIKVKYKDKLSPKPNLGSWVRDQPLHASSVNRHKVSLLEKLSRQKSQTSRRILESLQSDLVGHLIEVEHATLNTAPYLSTVNGYVRIDIKPSFQAVRCLIDMISRSTRTTFVEPEYLRTLSCR